MSNHDSTLNPVRQTQGQTRAVVFLHGFKGDRDDTWNRFPGLLGTHVPDWDIFTLGYSTTLGPDFKGIWKADPDLPILAMSFCTEFSIQPMNQYSSLALVAHSMGGLIVQKALVDDPGLQGRVKHLVMFGTPSNGLRKASWVKFWKSQLRNMAKDSDFIVGLRKKWTESYDSTFPFEFMTVAGTDDQFVPPESSLKPFDRRFHRSVPGDHLAIVKPKKADDTSLRLLISALCPDVKPPSEPTEPLHLAAAHATPDVLKLVKASEKGGMTERELVASALALERTGERDTAIEILERHKHLGTDVQGTLAGRMKRLWIESEEEHYARRAYDLYEGALDQAKGALGNAKNAKAAKKAHGQVYYHAINVAFLDFVVFDRLDKAKEMAELAMYHASQVGDDIWSIATCAEAELYLGNFDDAVDGYRKMLGQEAEEWKHASAMLQAAQIVAKIGDRELGDRFEVLFGDTA